jgi:hypothetical protein
LVCGRENRVAPPPLLSISAGGAGDATELHSDRETESCRSHNDDYRICPTVVLQTPAVVGSGATGEEQDYRGNSKLTKSHREMDPWVVKLA